MRLTLKEWFNGSALFSGGHVTIELHVAPGDRDVSVLLDHVQAGDPLPGIETACGSDDRVGSNDNRVGRLFTVGCTAWGITNGAFLTAGHCADFDPDNGGPLLPDGALDLAGVLEFNVPASTNTGALVAANPNDQYPVDVTSVQWRFDGSTQGLGKDWCVFRVNRNSNTLLLPWQAYGVPFRVTREIPSVGDVVRVTGFGTDTGAANQTNQTSTGPFHGESDATQADIWVTHRVDTEAGNSGSPLIWESMNLTYGIHTDGGCTSDLSTSNVGTSFEVNALETAINNFPGPNTRYADWLHPLRVQEDGTLFRPFASLGSAINATPNNGVCSMYVGVYSLPAGTRLNRPMTLQAPIGGVVILGN
jgi:V8-like Glu-specific endopeptidase